MNLLVDTHTHTVLSGHAFSTLVENAKEASEKKMHAIVCTEHGPGIEGGAPAYVIGVLRGMQEYMENIQVFVGTEANIMDHDGTIDIPERFLEMTDFAVASLHDIVIDPGDQKTNTETLLKVLDNQYIDAIGHPGNPYYPIDPHALVLETKKQNKVIEINSHSFAFRKGSTENCIKIMKLCKKHGVRITVASDAHISYDIGEFSAATSILEALQFPEELIVSRDIESFLAYVYERKSRLLKNMF
ncbi:MAG: phosphatase [Christensenellaceae bacterium]